VAHVERAAAIARFGELGGPPAAQAIADVLARPEDDAAFAKYAQLCFPLYARQGFDPVKMARSIINRELINHFFGENMAILISARDWRLPTHQPFCYTANLTRFYRSSSRKRLLLPFRPAWPNLSSMTIAHIVWLPTSGRRPTPI
jgi:hypothetical protein